MVEIGREIVLRLYLTIGAVAMIVLAALAATSNDRAVPGLGSARWNALHGCVHAAAALAAVHFLLCSRTNTLRADADAGASRLARRLSVHAAPSGDVSPLRLVALAAAAAGLTAGAEIAWHAARNRRRSVAGLAAHLDPTSEVRPAWWVLIAGLAAAFLGAYGGFGRARCDDPDRPSCHSGREAAAILAAHRAHDLPNATAGSACGQIGELMAEPGELALGVMPGVALCHIGGGFERDLA